MNDAPVMSHLRRSLLWLWTQQALGNAMDNDERRRLDDDELFLYADSVSRLANEVTE